MAAQITRTDWLLGLGGAVGGAVVGYFAFFLLAREGFYGLILPGALMGLGCGALAGGQSKSLGIVCGVLALLVGIFTEWRFEPFIVDDSLAYFVTHLHKLKTTTIVLIAAGGLFGIWFGRGRPGGTWPRRRKPAAAAAQRPPRFVDEK
jgi:hypothetical protein